MDQLKIRWDNDRQDGRQDEYVNVFDEELDDEIYKDARKLIPAGMKNYIRQVFGDDGFMIRADMIDNAIGYRAPSVTDAWTQISRMDGKTQKVFRDVATAVLGRKAFPWLKTAEQGWQAGVSVAKNTIIVRSVIVPASNMASNFLQLMTLGVGVRDMAKGYPAKLVEIDQFLRNQRRRVEIKAEMARYRRNNAIMRKLESELQSLEDAEKRMTIYPLIQEGEFSTISEGLTDADASIGQGKWADWMENQIERFPKALGTAGRYAMVTRDTALFKGMSRAVQYGDFLSKAVVYDHLTKRKGMSHEDAMAKVTEEFVNYNLLPGRTRSYAESMGLTWFWAYKLKSLKIAHRHMRDNPFRALMMTLGTPMLPDMPGVSVGSPITDNIASATIDGRLGYSVGTGMLFNAPSLNPWVNLAH